MHPDERGNIVGYGFVGDMISKLKDPYSPIYMTDGYRVYQEALLRHLGKKVRKLYGGRGRPPKWKFRFPDYLNYGQVIKTRNGMKLENVEYKVMSGTIPEEWFNTSAVERMNLTIRNSLARLKRISMTFSKDMLALEQSCHVIKAYYNFCRPHMTLSKGHDSKSPAMEMGLTDEIWSVRKLMSFPYRQNIR